MSYTLTKQDLQETVIAEQTAWSVKLVVTSSDEVLYPPKVFVFQAEDPANPDTRGWFTAVATPAQLLEYPEDAPVNASGELQQPYYRLDHVQFVSRNTSQLVALTADLMEELQLLADNIRALSLLEDEETVGTTHD